ncbi:triphosphoribosyl-dephospho-CoA synthase CitG [Utexia brackfieldae]|uniref:triphosphoribosyl-dephospho-CoA synthase CitG n=1 Tax=Utexia brackfieldae TaxID=3074108 RepID=UPI00370D3DE8
MKKSISAMHSQSSIYLDLCQQLTQQHGQLLFMPAKLAQQALLKEIYLSPKPGLVDQCNSGSHRDMDLQTFLRSILAISPFFDHFYRYGLEQAEVSPEFFLQALRVIGLDCEKAMFDATQGINTHKGAIFAFGLILAALGRLQAQRRTDHAEAICDEVASICQDLIERELIPCQGNSAGERLYRLFQFTGARGEAQSGYQLVRQTALPTYLQSLKQGFDEETALLQAMLHLLAVNNDTNVIARGGLAGLEFVQQQAVYLLTQGGALVAEGRHRLSKFDRQLIEKNLSPGGTADLIAVTWFLSHYR